MIYWIVQVTIISLITIFLIHYLFVYFKSTLTVHQVKDFVNKPTKIYEEIFNTLSDVPGPVCELNTSGNMKEELKRFLEEEGGVTSSINQSTTTIAELDSYSNNNYSQFN